MNILVHPALLAILFLSFYVRGSYITFEATPTTIQSLMTRQLTLRCSLHGGPTSGGLVGRRDSSATDMVIIHSIAISKNGDDVAMVSQNISATAIGDSTSVVSGQLEGSGERGYLQITWSYPGAQQTGEFVCDSSGIDSNGHSHTLTQNLEISENEISYADLIGYIHGIQASIDDLNKNNTAQTVSIDKLQKIISEQQNTISEQAATISALKHNQETKVLFTAAASRVTVPNAQTVVFDTLVTSVGGGYDHTTGMFTAPVSGYYMAHMHAVGQHNQYAEFFLQHNNKNVVFIIADDGYEYQTGSNSAALLLHTGDTVKVVSNGVSHLDGSTTSTFSMQLVSLI